MGETTSSTPDYEEGNSVQNPPFFQSSIPSLSKRLFTQFEYQTASLRRYKIMELKMKLSSDHSFPSHTYS